MSRATSTAGIGRPATHYGDVAPDTGCFVSPRCTSCPLRICVKEMRSAERGEFTAAWRTLQRYMAPADGVE